MKRNSKQFFSTQRLVVMAMLTAVQIILARYLAIQVNEVLRISFETVPLALAGMWLGPLGGALVALVSDILGTIIYGYGVWFPPIALGPLVFTLLCAWGTRQVFPGCLQDKKGGWKIVAVLVTAGIFNALLIGPLTTTWYQMLFTSKAGTFPVLLLANLAGRITTKPFVIAACSALAWCIHRAMYRPVVVQILGRRRTGAPTI